MPATTRYVVVLASPVPSGVCPVCNQIMDDGGCRLGARYSVTAAARCRTGIRRIVEVFCRGVPAHPIRPCPACEHVR